MSTTQQSAPEKKAETKRAEGGEISVKQDATTPVEVWRADMERLMGDWFSAWSGLGRLHVRRQNLWANVSSDLTEALAHLG